MIRSDRKSDCAINHALEVLGDPWSLLIVRDIAFYKKTEFGEFMASDERIGSNTLSRRLESLEQQGIVGRRKSTDDRRKDHYELTDMGLALVPLLAELALWGAAHDPDTGASDSQLQVMRTNRDKFVEAIQRAAPTVA